MAGRKKQSQSASIPGGSKSGYVRSLPKTLSAKEVVQKAASEGVQLSIGQVYNIRSMAKKRQGKAKRPAGRPAGRPAAAAAAAAPKASASSSSSSSSNSSVGGDAALRKAIAEVGLSRARAILAEVDALFKR